MEYLEFERPVSELENQIRELQNSNLHSQIDLTKEIKALQDKVDQLVNEIYSNLSSWERVQLSRHPQRPHTLDYINSLITDFREVAGDRNFGNDQAMVAGFGFFEGQKVAVIGIEKGRKTKEKMIRNFGMPRPEGYRKALRVMKLASQFKLPILSFIDTPGAYPGIDAEERGQSQAISENLVEMFDLKTPTLSVIIGEGGSGGALGLAISDRVFMMEYSIYSVISPESCASILWSDPKQGDKAANALNLGPHKSLELGVIDGIIQEPTGGAHRNAEFTFLKVKEKLAEELAVLKTKKIEDLLEERFLKFRRMGNSTLAKDQDENLELLV